MENRIELHPFLPPNHQFCVPLHYSWQGYEQVLIASYAVEVELLKEWYRNCGLQVDIRSDDEYPQYNLERGLPGNVRICFEVLFINARNEEMVDDSSSYLAASDEFKAVTKKDTKVIVVLFVCDPPKERIHSWN